jgi:hypothetical protein
MRQTIILSTLALAILALSCGRDKGLTLSLGEGEAEPGRQVCVPLTAGKFKELLSMQYTIAWDPEVIRLQTIKNFGLPGLTFDNFGRPPGRPDRLTFAWFEPNLQSVDLPEGKVIFELCFQAVGASGTQSSLTIEEDPTIIEIANVKEEVVPLNPSPGKIKVR